MRRRAGHGFTLVELLVALAVLALLAAMGWRGTEALLSTREGVERTSQALLGWQTALAQWQADWDAAVTGDTPDGGPDLPRWSASDAGVRWVRRTPDGGEPSPGWQVVAWGTAVDAHGQRRWTRWVSAPVRDHAALAVAWASALSRLGSDGVRTVPIEGWTLQVWRDGGWHPPDDGPAPPAVRLVLRPAAGTAPGGPVQVDWVVPWIAGGKR